MNKEENDELGVQKSVIIEDFNTTLTLLEEDIVTLKTLITDADLLNMPIQDFIQPVERHASRLLRFCEISRKLRH